MKRLFLLVLCILSMSSFAHVNDMTEDINLTGSLKKKGFLSRGKVDFSLSINKEFAADSEISDSYYRGKNMHLLTFDINGVECSGLIGLAVDDELFNQDMVSVEFVYDQGGRTEGCPYHLQVFMSKSDLDAGSDSVYTEATIWKTNSKKTYIKGEMTRE